MAAADRGPSPPLGFWARRRRLTTSDTRLRSPRSAPSDVAPPCARSPKSIRCKSVTEAPFQRRFFVIYLDGTLLAPGWERELKPGGICLVNTADALDDPRLLAIDADGLATELLGRPIPNTVFLGGAGAACRLRGPRKRGGGDPPVHAREAARGQHQGGRARHRAGPAGRGRRASRKPQGANPQVSLWLQRRR